MPLRFLLFLLFMGHFSLGLSQTKQFHGIDVSHHNGIIDWKTVSENKNIQFVYIKATEGKTHTDKRYKENISEARKYGLKVGSYHYFRMTSGAHEQFKHLSKVIVKSEQDLIPMIDVETADKHPISEIRDSLRVLLRLMNMAIF